MAVLGALVALLVLFIGERFPFRMLSEVWQELPMSQPVQSIPTNGTGRLEANH